jgi:glycosyltransferase involved in cell wall biosynthesis
MILIEHSLLDQDTIHENFGVTAYSYWFVRKAFRPVIERLGKRVEVSDPVREVDPIFRSAREKGEDCVFLCFSPPQNVPLGLACPTLPVFAWEYDTIPDEMWNLDPRDDWRNVFSRTGLAVTHCQSSVAAVRRTMGKDFPVWAIPAPVFDRHAGRLAPAVAWRKPFELVLEGGLCISAGDVDLSPFRPERADAEGVRALRVLERAYADQGKRAQGFSLEGAIYTAVLAPGDGRKNWRDMVTAFVWAFRNTPTATLILKLTHNNIGEDLLPLFRHLSTLGSYSCRIILVSGMLSNEAYSALAETTTYAVNTSHGEGQCLPLMEYMSAGRPAIAPRHTAMLDYITRDNAFVIASDTYPAAWPHDERCATRCLQHVISFSDLVRQYRNSYRIARDDPGRYARMSGAAIEAMRGFCSDELADSRLADVLKRALHGLPH